MRRRQLERALYQDVASSQLEKDEKRRSWGRKESDHLRETRVMKGHRSSALTGNDITTSKYEAVKVLGKGSFGVVRLVREKAEQE